MPGETEARRANDWTGVEWKRMMYAQQTAPIWNSATIPSVMSA